MLCCNKTDVSEGNDFNKTGASKECDICHFWYFLYEGRKFLSNVCNVFHDLLMILLN